MNVYLEDIADEFSSSSYHGRSSSSSSLSRGLLKPRAFKSRHQQTITEQQRRKRQQQQQQHSGDENARASRQFLQNRKSSNPNPPSSWVSDPDEQWAWLYRVMEEARKKEQNVRILILGLLFLGE